MKAIPVLNLDNTNRAISRIVSKVVEIEPLAQRIQGNCPGAWGLDFHAKCRGDSRPPTEERCLGCWKKALMEYAGAEA